MIIASHQRTRSSTKTINNVMTVSPYNIQSREMGYQSRATFWPPNIPQTEITPKMLNTALPTMVPIPKSLLVTKVPIMFVKSSGALVPAKKKVGNPGFFFKKYSYFYLQPWRWLQLHHHSVWISHKWFPEQAQRNHHKWLLMKKKIKLIFRYLESDMGGCDSREKVWISWF